jgi:hypothetical protein
MPEVTGNSRRKAGSVFSGVGMQISPARIGHWSARHRWLALAIWMTFVAASVALGAAAGTRTLSDGAVGESARGVAVMDQQGLWGRPASTPTCTAAPWSTAIQAPRPQCMTWRGASPHCGYGSAKRRPRTVILSSCRLAPASRRAGLRLANCSPAGPASRPSPPPGAPVPGSRSPRPATSPPTTLSMDYHVFTLSRIQEAVTSGEPTRQAIGRSVSRTSGVITAAALVMVCVFALFGTLASLDLKQAGTGLAVAVLLDVTVIRSVLLPAAMAVLGERNWYLPRWLAWLPSLGREAPAAHEQAVTSARPVPLVGLEPR